MQMFRSFQDLTAGLNRNMTGQFLRNCEQALDEVGAETQAEIHARIGNYPQNMGRTPPWARLAQSTLEIKQRKGYGLGGKADSPLFASGAFQQSIGMDRKGALYVMVGTNKPYIEYTEQGTSRMPPRPVIGPSAEYAVPLYLSRLQQLSAAGIVGASVPVRQPGNP